MTDDPIDRLRRICLALPETSERISHGQPAWFVREKKQFVMATEFPHEGRAHLRCAAPDGVQSLLVDADPEKFFIPPYVGHRGWLGVRLDVPTDWDEIADLVEDAWRTVAPKRLVAAYDARGM